MLFEDAYEDFKIYASKRHKKQCFDTINQNFKKHVLPYFCGSRVQDLTIRDVISWQDNIIGFNFSNSYNKNLYCAFNSFLKFCVLNEYIVFNYLKDIGAFKKKFEIHEYNIYSYFDFRKFRKGLDNLIYCYFFDILFFYGLRSGEAMALKFKDIKGNKLCICSSIQRRGKRAIDTPKTANSVRDLKLSLLMRFKLLILKCYYLKKYGYDSLDYFVFGGLKPLSPTSIKRYKHKACINSNIREIKVHEFRHSCATRMIKKGIPVEKVSKFLGHSSISITLDYYVHHEKKKDYSFFSRLDFFHTINQNCKKIISSIITHFV